MENRPTSIIRNLMILATVPLGTHAALAGDPAVMTTANNGVCLGRAPLGASLNGIMGMQIQKGLAARMVLYNYDFFPAEGDLTPRGRRQLSKIARRFPMAAAPIQIQPTGNAELDELRRTAVQNELAILDVTIPPDQVQIAYPAVRPLDGLDATMNDRKLQRQMPIAQPNSGSQSPTPSNTPQNR